MKAVEPSESQEPKNLLENQAVKEQKDPNVHQEPQVPKNPKEPDEPQKAWIIQGP